MTEHEPMPKVVWPTALVANLAEQFSSVVGDARDYVLLDDRPRLGPHLDFGVPIANAWQSLFGPVTGDGPTVARLIAIRLDQAVADSPITLPESASPPDVGETLAIASRDGIAGLTPVQLLIVVLVWLLAFGTPLIQETLPPEAQSVVTGDIGTASLALTITILIIQQRRR